jgi:hypothetical protein
MISTTQNPEQLISKRTQVVADCADSIVRPKCRKSVDSVRPAAGPPRNNLGAQRNSDASDQDLIDQAFADYWTL